MFDLKELIDVYINLALCIQDLHPISKFLSPNDHHYKLAKHFSHLYVTTTPIQQTARTLIVLTVCSVQFSKGRDLHGNAGSPPDSRKTVYRSLLLLLRKPFPVSLHAHIHGSSLYGDLLHIWFACVVCQVKMNYCKLS